MSGRQSEVADVIPSENRIVPHLIGSNGERFEPDTVTTLKGTLPWDTQATQLQCGSTVVANNQDFNMRLTMECVATQEQFQNLQAMRTAPTNIKLISAPYAGPITFDELTWEQLPDVNGTVTQSGEDTQPRYNIQLQSKEETDDGE